MSRLFFRQVKDWANSQNCEVKKVKGKYHVWNKNSKMATYICSSLKGVIHSVIDVGDAVDDDALEKLLKDDVKAFLS